MYQPPSSGIDDPQSADSRLEDPAPGATATPQDSPDDLEPDVPVRQLIRDLQDGKLTIDQVPVSDRRACVQQLARDGYTRQEIALLLRTSESTITRDRRAIRKANAVHAAPGLAGELAGEFLRLCESIEEQMRRVSRDEKATPAARLATLKGCFQTARDKMKLLQSLGYLPNVKPTPGTPGTPGNPRDDSEHSQDPEVGFEVTSGGASGGFGCDDNTGSHG